MSRRTCTNLRKICKIVPNLTVAVQMMILPPILTEDGRRTDQEVSSKVSAIRRSRIRASLVMKDNILLKIRLTSQQASQERKAARQDCESRIVTNPYLEKAQEYLEQYGYGDEEEKTLRDKSTPRLKIRDKVEQIGNVLANVFDDGSDSVDPTRPNVCNSFLNKGACLQPGCKYLHFRPDAAYPSHGYRKGHSNKSYGHSLANVLGSVPSRPLQLGNQIKHVFSTQRQATVDLVLDVGFNM